jgi:hypothetical protein
VKSSQRERKKPTPRTSLDVKKPTRSGKSVLNHTPDDRERENNLLLLLLRAFVCVSEDALFEAKLLLFLKAKKEQSFGQKFQRKPAHKCAIRFSYER